MPLAIAARKGHNGAEEVGDKSARTSIMSCIVVQSSESGGVVIHFVRHQSLEDLRHLDRSWSGRYLGNRAKEVGGKNAHIYWSLPKLLPDRSSQACRCLGPFQLYGSHVMGSYTHLSLESLHPNASHVIGSCTPPYERPNKFATDTFSKRFDNGIIFI